MEVILPYLEGKKNRKGRCLVFCGMDIVPNLSVFRHYWNGLVIVLIHPGHRVVLSFVDVL